MDFKTDNRTLPEIKLKTICFPVRLTEKLQPEDKNSSDRSNVCDRLM